MKSRYILASTAVTFIVLSAGFVKAGPTVIQDNRITNLAVTPALGRGYSVATNTYQSICLKDIKMTEPSYDFTYTFHDFTDFWESSSSETNALNKVIKSSFREYVDEISKEDTGDTKTTVKEKVREEETETKKGAQTKAVTTKKKIHRMMAIIRLHSYYASVDESSTGISDSAASLLDRNDILGFFNSCGSYYIRSIGRNAYFVSIFAWEVSSTKDVEKFKYLIETELKSFRKKITTEKSWWGKKTTTTETEDSKKETLKLDTEDGEEKDTFTDEFVNFSEKNHLTITTSAFGLGKDKNATLISYDTTTFKAAIKDAFLSMQNPRTGKVTSIEVVPWVENTDFQKLIKLDDDGGEPEYELDDKGNVKLDKNGRPILKKKGVGLEKKLLLYEKKLILNENSEFIAEVERANRNLLNIYYKAKLCKQHIDANWKETIEKKRTLRPDLVKRYVRNNRNMKSGVKLTILDNYLTRGRIKQLLKDQKTFMYGGGKWGNGARECLTQIMSDGIFRKRYSDIEDCQVLSEQMGQHEAELVEDHCMPVLYAPNSKPEEKEIKRLEKKFKEYESTVDVK